MIPSIDNSNNQVKKRKSKKKPLVVPKLTVDELALKNLLKETNFYENFEKKKFIERSIDEGMYKVQHKNKKILNENTVNTPAGPFSH